jgi:hypothetical protein
MGSLWNRSGIVERFGADDIKAPGALAYFYQGSTTTPQTVYQDAGQASAHAFPVVADSNGRWPDVFVPYINTAAGYDVRVTTSDGVQLSFSQNIPNPNPVDVSVTIPAENQVQTGMIHGELINSTKTGYVRLNGRTIGNAVSGGTERANADTSALFTYLWNNVTDALAPVSGGRGGSAAVDYAANKTITLPDMRGSIMSGLDDMGNSAAGNFSGVSFLSGSAILPGSATGGNSLSLVLGNIPAHTHTGSTTTDGSHQHTGTTGDQSNTHTHSTTVTFSGNTGTMSANTTPSFSYRRTNESNQGVNGTGPNVTVNKDAFDSTTGTTNIDHTHSISLGPTAFSSGAASGGHSHSFTSDFGGNHSHTFTTSSTGSGTAFNNMPLAKLFTWFIKL